MTVALTEEQSQQVGDITPATVQENFIAYFRIFAGLPGVTYVEEEEAIWTACHGAPGSQVLKSYLDPARAGAQIDAILRRAGEHVDAIDWMIWPGDGPENLGALLAERGEAGGPDGEWMLHGNRGKEPGTWLAIDLDALPPSLPVADGFRVERVSDPEQFEVWVDINARGFGSEDYSAFRSAYLRHGFGDDAQAIHFIGYQGTTPVTSSTLLLAGGSASAYNISVPESLRCQGFGGAISHATLLEARARGYRNSWIWSSEMGRSVYQRIGFVIVDFGIREYQWKKRG